MTKDETTVTKAELDALNSEEGLLDEEVTIEAVLVPNAGPNFLIWNIGPEMYTQYGVFAEGAFENPVADGERHWVLYPYNAIRLIEFTEEALDRLAAEALAEVATFDEQYPEPEGENPGVLTEDG